MNRREFLKTGGATAAAALAPWSARAISAGRGDLAVLPATQQLERFAAGTLSPVDVVEAQIARAGAGSIRFDGAVAAALDAEWRFRRGEARALDGITVGVVGDREGEPVVARLRQAGAIPLTPEGGPGEALATGRCTLAVVPDPDLRIAVDRPGIYAFRRARRRVATVDELLVARSHPMGRTLDDAFLLEAVLIGRPANGPVARSPRASGARVAYCAGAGSIEGNADRRRWPPGISVGEIAAPRPGCDLESLNALLQHRVFRAGYDVLVTPARATPFDRLNWYPTVIAAGLQILAQPNDVPTAARVAAGCDALPDFRDEV